MIKPILNIAVKALLDMDDWTLEAQPPIIVRPLKRRRTGETSKGLTNSYDKCHSGVADTVAQDSSRGVELTGIIEGTDLVNRGDTNMVKQDIKEDESSEVIGWNAGGCITLAELSVLIPSDLRVKLKRFVLLEYSLMLANFMHY